MVKTVLKVSLVIVLFTSSGFLLLNNNALQAKTPSSARPFPQAQANIDITVDEIVVSGLQRPVQVTHAGDGSDRLFVVEQGGRILVIKNGSLLATPFLNISSLVSCCGERGLLGLAFHPNYKNNGYFYIQNVS